MKILNLFAFVFFFTTGFTQWSVLPNSPFESFRHDDIYFLNSDTGFAVNNQGIIWKTTDGGDNWEIKLKRNTTFFRCVSFLNDTLGFVGTLGDEAWFGRAKNDTILYKTTDGGESWSPIFDAIFGDKAEGLCGLFRVNDSTIVGVGRIGGPAHFLKTTDYGQTWTSKDLSSHLGSLIEVYFSCPDTGLIFGGTEIRPNNSRGIILKTMNGGLNWDTLFVSSNINEWCWKVFFSSEKIGYVTLQSARTDTINFLKTIDGGKSWGEKLFLPSGGYWTQGVGFLNDSVGWVGGDLNKVNSYYTEDGGNTWTSVLIGDPINRFRKINDSLLYSAGQRIYKYGKNIKGVLKLIDNRIYASLAPRWEEDLLTLSENCDFDEIYIYDYAGRRLISIYKKRDEYCQMDMSGLPDGIYLLIAKKGDSFLKQTFVKE